MPDRVIEDVVCAHTTFTILQIGQPHSGTQICTCSLKDVDLKENMAVAVLTVIHARQKTASHYSMFRKLIQYKALPYMIIEANERRGVIHEGK